MTKQERRVWNKAITASVKAISLYAARMNAAQKKPHPFHGGPNTVAAGKYDAAKTLLNEVKALKVY